MKCLSLWQPWASLWAAGLKRNETRSWPTAFRGTVAIHAAQKWTREMRDLCLENPVFQTALLRLRPNQAGAFHLEDALPLILPRGVIVGTVEIGDCLATHRIKTAEANITPELDRKIAETLCWAGHGKQAIADAMKPMLTPQELAFGDYTDGRYAWLGRNHRLLEEPVPCAGRQGMFNIPDDLIGATPL